MKIRKHISKGMQHKIYCEDYLIDVQINDTFRLCGVFDGCSTGIDSHFASTLFGKSFLTAVKFLPIGEKPELKKIIYNAFENVKKVARDMDMKTEEMLSTVLIMLIDNIRNRVSIVSIGDGVLSLNGGMTVVNQQNTPDYPAYHLFEYSSFREFENYYNNLLQFNNIEFSDISISTDGILSFVNTEMHDLPKIKPEDYFLKDDFLLSNNAMLSRKYNILKNKFMMQNQDDLAIIRVIND